MSQATLSESVRQTRTIKRAVAPGFASRPALLARARQMAFDRGATWYAALLRQAGVSALTECSTAFLAAIK